jgi:hypothetical protein
LRSSAKNLDNCIGKSGKKASHGCPVKAGDSIEFRAETFQCSSKYLANPAREREFDCGIQTTSMSEEELRTVGIQEFRQAGESARIGLNSLKHWEGNWSSYKGLTVDTLAHRGDEGRGYLR